MHKILIELLRQEIDIPFLFQSIVTLSALKKLLLAKAEVGPPKFGYWYNRTKEGPPLLPGT